MSLRILSLLPAATDIIKLLGLEKNLVGTEKDLATSEISNEMGSSEIDRNVKASIHRGVGVFHIDQEKLKKLKPNIILTQELCRVCAIGFTEVRKAARILDGDVKIVSLEPESVEDILENIQLVGESSGKSQESRKIVEYLRKRLKILDSRLLTLVTKPRVLVIEWLDPVMVAGHWVPQMVEFAGGKMLVTKPAERSRRIKLEQMRERPDIVVIAPCGFDIERIRKEKELLNRVIRDIGNVRVFLMDGNAYMTRPGPRIVDGVEILAEILHPEIPGKHKGKGWIRFGVNGLGGIGG